jgi:NAD(P)-dependent dehydrogenase (short-subunit alcohol dehydrogenase family)
MSKLSTFSEATVVVVIGASGGIGAALVKATGAIAFCRPEVDLTDEASIKAAAARIKAEHGTIDVVIVATGVLHSDGIEPEKTWTRLNPAVMAQVFAVNTIGPALVAKHFLPLLAKGRKSVFAALSARVGSIGDNGLGGWISYRASKAALNQVIRTFSIELKRKNPDAICIGLHPGTVNTGLSEPFQGSAPKAIFSPDEAADYLLSVINGVTTDDTGDVFDWAGQRIEP